MKKALLAAFMLGLASAAGAQTSSTSGTGECKLTQAQAPALRGIRLGMSVDQVLAQIPGSEADSDLLARLSRDRFGSRYANVLPGRYATSREKFAGIEGLNLTFLDGRLVSFLIYYQGTEWSNREQFAARVAEALNLPGVGAWKPSSDVLAVACEGFEISVQTSPPNGAQIAIKDTTVDVSKVVHDREEVPKEKARRAFKP